MNMIKSFLNTLIPAAVFCAATGSAQTDFTNFIRQVQFPTGVVQDVTVDSVGADLESKLAIDPGGARFELHTVAPDASTSYLLDSSYVGTYIPIVTVAIRSEDNTSEIVRTRADRPFFVDLTVEGLLSGADDPAASKSFNFMHHVQSYGAGGTGIDIDRTQATLLSQSSITTNGTSTYTFTLTSVPGADRSKIRGEERFSAFSLDDIREGYEAPASQLSSKYIQIWPVADGTITGINQNDQIRFLLPSVTLTLNDLYPNSTTYAQVYKGGAALGTTGTRVPGSALVINDSVPQSRVLTLKDYDSVFDSDGQWTMELLTSTPFGIDRLAYVTFDLDRTIKVNGTVTTIE
jgi:hypothetical protein